MKMTIDSTAAKRGLLTKNLEKFMGGVRGGGVKGVCLGRKSPVFPAKAGIQIQPERLVGFTWAPAFAGETGIKG
jgi:hypothetical protein